MKKLVALLSLVAFFAINVNAQKPQAAPTAETKKEVSAVKADSKTTAVPACCAKANPACCKNAGTKNCTAEQKAACAKAGASKECSGHSKAEASEAKEDKSGLK